MTNKKPDPQCYYCGGTGNMLMGGCGESGSKSSGFIRCICMSSDDETLTTTQNVYSFILALCEHK